MAVVPENTCHQISISLAYRPMASWPTATCMPSALRSTKSSPDAIRGMPLHPLLANQRGTRVSFPVLWILLPNWLLSCSKPPLRNVEIATPQLKNFWQLLNRFQSHA